MPTRTLPQSEEEGLHMYMKRRIQMLREKRNQPHETLVQDTSQGLFKASSLNNVIPAAERDLVKR